MAFQKIKVANPIVEMDGELLCLSPFALFPWINHLQCFAYIFDCFFFIYFIFLFEIEILPCCSNDLSFIKFMLIYLGDVGYWFLFDFGCINRGEKLKEKRRFFLSAVELDFSG